MFQPSFGLLSVRLSGRPLSCPLHFSAWKSKYTVRMLVTKDDRAHFLMMLGQGKVEDIQTQVSTLQLL